MKVRFSARVSHPHIARLLDAGVTTAGQPYLVLEYVEGVRIDRHAAALRLGIDARLSLFLQVADAVAHAHANLIVHRDLKPSNVLVDAAGEREVARLRYRDAGGHRIERGAHHVDAVPAERRSPRSMRHPSSCPVER